MNYDTTSTEVQQVREESLLIQDLELNQLQTLSEEQLQEVVGGLTTSEELSFDFTEDSI